MNVLLTSATGYIGSAVASALQTQGHSVSAIARTDGSVQRLEVAGVQPIRGDLIHAASLQRAAQSVDAVIHTAATNDAQMATIDRQAIESLISALEGTQKPLIYTSGVWVMGDTHGQCVDERFPLDPSPIVAWRPAIEDLVLSAAALGIRAIVIRPALVYGRGGGLVSMLIQSGREQGAVPVVGDGQNHWSLIHVDDLARLYVQAMEHASTGTVWIGSSGESLPLKTVALAAAHAAGMGDRLQFLTLEDARQRWGSMADAFALDQRVLGDRARQFLHWTPSAPSLLEDLGYPS